MFRLITTATAAAAAVAALALVPAAAADSPFPAPAAGGVFVSAQTVDTTRAVSNYFAPGATVVFRAWAADVKTHKVLTGAMATYFYVTIPNQPNVKLKYDPKAPEAAGRMAWIGHWTVPASYVQGTVHFKVLVKAKSKRTGSFVQMNGATAQLTISSKPQSPPAAGPGSPVPAGSATPAMGLYVDSVNGSKPVGAKPRNIGCTQTNVYHRGEQVVVRSWGIDLATGAALTPDNVQDAHFTIPGQADIALTWGSHGAAKVFFWTNFWNIPAAYPLGDVNVRVSFTNGDGKTALFDYPITIIP